MARSCWMSVAAVLGALTQPGPPAAAQPPEIPVRKLTVSPAAAPEPALRYRLLPELRETSPGNAALLYYRAFAPDWWGNLRGNKDLQEKVEGALDKSPAEV